MKFNTLGSSYRYKRDTLGSSYRYEGGGGLFIRTFPGPPYQYILGLFIQYKEVAKSRASLSVQCTDNKV